MPKQLQPDAYCSAPPLSTTTLRPPRISRDIEVRRPRAPLVIVKREIDSSEVESVEFVVDDEFTIDVKPQPKVVNRNPYFKWVSSLSRRNEQLS